MRLRRENLKTGKALAWIDPQGKSRTRVLLFLVEGAEDIDPLTNIEVACHQYISGHGFAWHPVADAGQISLVDSRLSGADVLRFEASEFRGLQAVQIAELLRPVLNRIANGHAELLPRTGGAVGSPAEGIQFLNREAEANELFQAITRGESLLLHAPRRMGKTSLMRRLECMLGTEFETFTLNGQRDPSPAEIGARLRSHLEREPFRAALGTVKHDATRYIRQSLHGLCNGVRKPFVLFFDELTSIFDNIKQQGGTEASRRAQISDFLAAFGEPLSEHKGRLIIASSIDITDYLSSELDLKTDALPGLFSTMKRVGIKPLKLDQPECELRRLLLGSGVVAGPEDLNWVRDHIDLAVPYPALRFLDALVCQTRERGHIGNDDFDSAFHEFLAKTDAFEYFDEHLRGKTHGRAQQMTVVSEAVDTIARERFQDGASEEQVKAVLQNANIETVPVLWCWLRDTFPVSTSGGRIRFTSHLFWHWWRAQIRPEGFKP